jgi:hypothetical protein
MLLYKKMLLMTFGTILVLSVCSWLVSCVVMLLTHKGRSYYQVLTYNFNRQVEST